VEHVDRKGETGYIGKPCAKGTKVSGSGKKGNVKSSNTLKYQEHKAIIPHEAKSC
jgi:hypothetical protein